MTGKLELQKDEEYPTPLLQSTILCIFSCLYTIELLLWILDIIYDSKLIITRLLAAVGLVLLRVFKNVWKTTINSQGLLGWISLHCTMRKQTKWFVYNLLTIDAFGELNNLFQELFWLHFLALMRMCTNVSLAEMAMKTLMKNTWDFNAHNP